MYHSAVEQDFGRVRDGIEGSESFVELIVVVITQRRHPRLDLPPQDQRGMVLVRSVGAPTCLRDIGSEPGTVHDALAQGPTDLLSKHKQHNGMAEIPKIAKPQIAFEMVPGIERA